MFDLPNSLKHKYDSLVCKQNSLKHEYDSLMYIQDSLTMKYVDLLEHILKKEGK